MSNHHKNPPQVVGRQAVVAEIAILADIRLLTDIRNIVGVFGLSTLNVVYVLDRSHKANQARQFQHFSKIGNIRYVHGGDTQTSNVANRARVQRRFSPTIGCQTRP